MLSREKINMLTINNACFPRQANNNFKNNTPSNSLRMKTLSKDMVSFKGEDERDLKRNFETLFSDPGDNNAIEELQINAKLANLDHPELKPTLQKIRDGSIPESSKAAIYSLISLLPKPIKDKILKAKK